MYLHDAYLAQECAQGHPRPVPKHPMCARNPTSCVHVTMCMCARNPTSLLPNSHSSDPISRHILTSTSSSSHTSILNSRQIVFKLKFCCNAYRLHVSSTIAMHCVAIPSIPRIPDCGKSLSFSHGDGPSSC